MAPGNSHAQSLRRKRVVESSDEDKLSEDGQPPNKKTSRAGKGKTRITKRSIIDDNGNDDVQAGNSPAKRGKDSKRVKAGRRPWNQWCVRCVIRKIKKMNQGEWSSEIACHYQGGKLNTDRPGSLFENVMLIIL